MCPTIFRMTKSILCKSCNMRREETEHTLHSLELAGSQKDTIRLWDGILCPGYCIRSCYFFQTLFLLVGWSPAHLISPLERTQKKSQRNKREYGRQVWQVGHCCEERTKVMGSFAGRLCLVLLCTTHKH